ncbi:chorismate mutase [Luteimonas sp. RC10]|uniref:ubiquinone anaerobic biosynthesis accessory factor UbiT n=1 Tax=Luteimonas sp. RC10 TaxID=2587035 RepID=UPI0017D44928|nr:chorismate mutase [Luteimonas sp. RC10]MBB3344195.1 putative lipid carrier protein YhbT/chorismate mutase [Luteimonas sp. RC10]
MSGDIAMPNSHGRPAPPLAAIALEAARHGIDRIDAALIALLAARRGVAALAGGMKRALDRPLRDAGREAQVRAHAHRIAARLHVPGDTVDRLATLLIADACDRQSRSTFPPPRPAPAMTATASAFDPTDPSPAAALLRLLPPPARWKPVLRRLPQPVVEAPLERALSQVLQTAQIGPALDLVAGRRLGIEVEDLGIAMVLSWTQGRLRAVPGPAEASVRGSATDLMLLASRLEDADTLFFQRRLVLIGDVELGLTVRNLLDRMPWDTLPLGLRIALQRSARIARAARKAHRSA